MHFCDVDFSLKLNLFVVCCSVGFVFFFLLCCIPCFVHSQVFRLSLGVMLAVDAIIAELKKLSKPVTTPEEIAQVKKKKKKILKPSLCSYSSEKVL